MISVIVKLGTSIRYVAMTLLPSANLHPYVKPTPHHLYPLINSASHNNLPSTKPLKINLRPHIKPHISIST